MIWTQYQVSLRLLTPMHVGAGVIGNVQRTRPYLHGKALWGALTARLTRDNPHLGDYPQVGRLVNAELAFSYFYPVSGDAPMLFPWDDVDKFGWHFLSAHTGTALDYDRNAAQEGSLHETEFIAPVTREGKPVHLRGYIFQKERCSLPWQTALPRLQLGGERTYGWGRVSLEQPVEASILPIFDKFPMQLEAPRPTIQLKTKDHRVLAHMRTEGVAVGAVQGAVAPLVGRETSAANAHGRQPTMAAVCWEPGAKMKTPLVIQIQEHGLWSNVG